MIINSAIHIMIISFDELSVQARDRSAEVETVKVYDDCSKCCVGTVHIEPFEILCIDGVPGWLAST